MVDGVLRRFWIYLFGESTPKSCDACLSKNQTISEMHAQIEFLQTQLKEHQDIIFRRKEQKESKAPVSIGGFESLSRRRQRLEREARIRTNGTPEQKGWKNLDELEAEIQKEKKQSAS